ncbi:MAG TPA: NUDIX domain-containing protein [Candidatus Angelobacter sp.]|nr:NUDIX domain-containing protein [Candidatus Angelobacter sp.]
MPFAYEFARPALTVDCVIFGLDEEGLKILLIKRALEPFRGRWALPGGFVQSDETVDAAARRELEEETGLQRVFLEQLYTFGDLDRDPRERTVTVAYYALVNLHDHRVQAATDAENAAWFDAADLPRLAFDHQTIVKMALTRLKGKVRYCPIGFELLPQKFTLSQLQRLYEIILERCLDKRNFRKKVLQLGLLQELDEVEQDVAHRAARLYRFRESKYLEATKRGFSFEI